VPEETTSVKRTSSDSPATTYTAFRMLGATIRGSSTTTGIRATMPTTSLKDGGASG